jgi:hypothetical protein
MCLEKGFESLLVFKHLPKYNNCFPKINWEVYVLEKGFKSLL